MTNIFIYNLNIIQYRPDCGKVPSCEIKEGNKSLQDILFQNQYILDRNKIQKIIESRQINKRQNLSQLPKLVLISKKIEYYNNMKQSMFKSIKGFFNSNKQKNTSEIKQNKQQMEPRVISFGSTSKISKNQQQQTNISELPDNRYANLEEFPSLKDLNLKKDEIEEGQRPVFYDTKFIFSKSPSDKYEQVRFIVTNYKICILYKSIQPAFFSLGKIEKLNKYTANQSVYKMLIQLKDGRKFKFRINSEMVWKKVYDRIEMFAFIKSKKHFFAFKHFQHNQGLENQFKGWKLYDPITEFKRMGITMMQHIQETISDYKSDFKILDNRDGKICSTYPATLVVPSRMPYDALVRCAKFRSKQRMPALTYAYQYEKDKFSCIYRSSQSKVGVQNSRSSDDQLMLRMIGNHKYDLKNETLNGTGVNCKIYDARGFYAAFGNKISGKGYESQQFYSNCKLEFLNIPNIHAVRQAYNKTIEAAYGEDSKFFVSLAESKWYQYVYLILYGALDLAKNLSQGVNCLVHCSDGWDRTSQLCSLGALFLDPFYRTIQGFQILIEKDWINFGHQFAKRLGQGMNNPMSEEKSQIFLQFLDCITQIMHQFPLQFQFNFKFIQEIGQQAYMNLYGNFLCNCYMEILKCGAKEGTVSLWSKLKKDRDLYLNPFYSPSQKHLMSFDANQRNMRFWKQHFLQHIDNFKDVYGIYSVKFTQQNLQIIHRHLAQQKMLLQEKENDNRNILSMLQKQIQKLEKKVNGDNFQEKKGQQQIKQQLAHELKSADIDYVQNGFDELVDLNVKKQEHN